MYISLLGFFLAICQAIVEFFPLFYSEIKNTTTNDYWVHTACGISLFLVFLLADRFPVLWEGVGIWWILIHCISYAYKSYAEGYGFK